MDYILPTFNSMHFRHHTMDVNLPQPCDGMEYSSNCLYSQSLAYFEWLAEAKPSENKRVRLFRLTGQAHQRAKIMCCAPQPCLQETRTFFEHFRAAFPEDSQNYVGGGGGCTDTGCTG